MEKYFCGPMFFPKWVRKLASPEILNDSCKTHDSDFFKKNSFKTAMTVNIKFVKSMYSNIYKVSKYNLIRYLQATIYFILVCVFVPVYWFFYWRKK